MEPSNESHPGWTELIDAAIEQSIECLDVYQFAQRVGLTVPGPEIDLFFADVGAVYIAPAVTDLCGFGGSPAERLKCFYEALTASGATAGEDYWRYDNRELEKLRAHLGELPYVWAALPAGPSGKFCLILTADCMKMMLMALPTPCARDMRKKYLYLEKLAALYTGYTAAFFSKRNTRRLQHIEAISYASDDYGEPTRRMVMDVRKRAVAAEMSARARMQYIITCLDSTFYIKKYEEDVNYVSRVVVRFKCESITLVKGSIFKEPFIIHDRGDPSFRSRLPVAETIVLLRELISDLRD